MKTETKYFGEIEYEREELLIFPKGLFGFEDEHEFLLIPFSDNGTLFSPQSVKTPMLSFVLMHPFTLDESYAPVLAEEELKELGVTRSEDLYYYVMCAVKKPASESTINMKCPIAINPDTRVAMQAILEEGDWQMRHLLSEFEAKKGAASC